MKRVRGLRITGIVVCWAVFFCAEGARAGEAVEADVVLRGGTIYDGTGAAGYAGDVAIRGEGIVGVGKFEVKQAGRVVECTRLVVTPGYIDLHTHSDLSIAAEPTRANVNYLTQGVTTVVTGNCGGGPTDVAEMYAKINEHGAGSNVAHLIPHGSVRERVMGRVARDPTADELEQMRQIVDQGMRDGAWGMSTGLIYVPGTYSKTDEIVELAKVVAKHGGIYASHMRNENVELLAAVRETLEIGRRAGVPVHISHFKSAEPRAWGLVREAAKLVEQARAAGQRVTADQYPYTASGTSLGAMTIPDWALEGGDKELVRRFDDPAVKDKLRAEIGRRIEERGGAKVLRIAQYEAKKSWVGKSLAEIAEVEKAPPVDLVIEAYRNGGARAIHFGQSEEDVRFVMRLPYVATGSDGAAMVPNETQPHPRSYGTYPRKIGRYAIEMQVLPIEQAVRSATGLAADVLGMESRGYLKVGKVADVVVFDPATFRDTATFEKPHQYATGVKYVFANGKAAIEGGKYSGVLAGRALGREREK